MPKLDLNLMRASGCILAETLEFITKKSIKPGTTAYALSKKAEELIYSHKNAKPAFLGYRGFPAAACISINEQVVHGIPRKETIIHSGDLVSIDCGVLYKGHFSDACRTVVVGEVNSCQNQLVKTTEEALEKGISAAIIGNQIGDISFAIQKHIERNKFKVSLDFVGHGIGLALHQDPIVPNYGPPGRGNYLKEGDCLAIEPVVFDGSSEVFLDKDGWTVFSKEGNPSAHFEDTIIITKNGPEIITRT
jgi:methionyl aminopeptidase